jgi:hypothetical protein
MLLDLQKFKLCEYLKLIEMQIFFVLLLDDDDVEDIKENLNNSAKILFERQI